tara:strand:+ start:565 stop:762 length:198 start_codon:yes stop_codon:yes gene_type:complete
MVFFKSMINNWEIILAIVIVGLSVLLPIYYSSKKKKKEQEEELNKIKVYGESINKYTRSKHKKIS